LCLECKELSDKKEADAKKAEEDAKRAEYLKKFCKSRCHNYVPITIRDDWNTIAICSLCGHQI
jgi:hypothetical protein